VNPIIDQIVRKVAEVMNVTRAQMMGDSRKKHIVEARHIAMTLARVQTRLGYEEIGLHFGGRNHTSILHAVRMMNTRVVEDEQFAAIVRANFPEAITATTPEESVEYAERKRSASREKLAESLARRQHWQQRLAAMKSKAGAA